MMHTFISRACSDLPVAVCGRVMKVSTSGFYAWRAQPCSDRDRDDAILTNTIVDIHRMSRRSYGISVVVETTEAPWTDVAATRFGAVARLVLFTAGDLAGRLERWDTGMAPQSDVVDAERQDGVSCAGYRAPGGAEPVPPARRKSDAEDRSASRSERG